MPVVHIATLGDLLRERIGLYPWCDSCGRSGEDLDVLALAAAHGEGKDWRALKPRCRCGARGKLYLKWPGQPELDIRGAWIKEG